MIRSKFPTKVWRCGMACLLLALALPCAASGETLERWLSTQEYDIRYLGVGVTRQLYVEMFTAPLKRLDPDGNGFDEAALARFERSVAADVRGRAISSMLRADVDGDLRVTMAELGDDRLPRYRETPVRDLDAAHLDADADGVITLDEALRVARIESALDERVVAARLLMSLTRGRDGVLTMAELTELAEAKFRDADTDGDGVISAQEARPYNRLNQARRENPMPAATYCVLPPVEALQKLVLVGTGQSAGHGPPGVSNQATVTIEPGRGPLYLILSSEDQVVWRFVGDVRRVAHAIVMSRRLKDGAEWTRVEGLPATVVQVRPYRGCIPSFLDAKAPAGRWAAEAVRDVLGRTPDAVFAARQIHAVVLPAGAFEPWRPDPPLPRSEDEEQLAAQ